MGEVGREVSHAVGATLRQQSHRVGTVSKAECGLMPVIQEYTFLHNTLAGGIKRKYRQAAHAQSSLSPPRTLSLNPFTRNKFLSSTTAT